MPSELGVHHPRIVRAAELRTSKGRREYDRFLFEGPTLLAEALSGSVEIETVFATEQAQSQHSICASVPAGVLFTVNDRTIAKLSDLETPPGIVAVARRRLADPAALLAGNGALVLLAGLNDPGNVGTLIRSAEAFGLAGMLVLSGGADPYSPKVVRGAMGSLFRLPICTVTADELARNLGDRPFIAMARPGRTLREFRFPERPLLAVGHERHGLGSGLPQPTDVIEIPHIGQTESLNAAVAGSIVFYAFSSTI